MSPRGEGVCAPMACVAKEEGILASAFVADGGAKWKDWNDEE